MSDVCHRREYEAPADSVPHRLVGCGFAHRAVFDSDAACGFLAMADIVNRMRDAFLALDSTVARPTYTTGVDPDRQPGARGNASTGQFHGLAELPGVRGVWRVHRPIVRCM